MAGLFKYAGRLAGRDITLFGGVCQMLTCDGWPIFWLRSLAQQKKGGASRTFRAIGERLFATMAVRALAYGLDKHPKQTVFK